MPYKKLIISNNFYLHVFNKSIAGYQIFRHKNNARRFLLAVNYYNSVNVSSPLSQYLKENQLDLSNLLFNRDENIVDIIAYCLMPDHYHFLVKIKFKKFFIPLFSKIENSYSRFFNEKNKRRGPLWQSRFKKVIIESNEQLLHTVRYIHLNPVTDNLVKKPEDWEFSSYRFYISSNKLFRSKKEITIKTIKAFKKFTENQIHYQKKLRKIKKILLE